MASPNSNDVSCAVNPENGASLAMDHPKKEVLKLFFLLVTAACLWPALALFAFAVVVWSSINTLMLVMAERFPQFCGKAVLAHKESPSSVHLVTSLKEEPVLTPQPATLPFGLAPLPRGYQGFEYPDLADVSRVPVTPELDPPDTAPGLNPGYTTSSTTEEGSHAISEVPDEVTHNDHPEPQGWFSRKLPDKKSLGEFISGVRSKVRRRSLSEPEVASSEESKGRNDSESSGELGKKYSTESVGSTDVTQTEAFPMSRSGSYNEVVPYEESGDNLESNNKEVYEDSPDKSPEAWRKMTSALLKPVSKFRQRKKKGA